ncbi:MAG TPA: hypothetical protein VG798_02455 [Rhizomicrobium sp.]|nr:hypothetical protein [Rhizomicrobium sp.]HWC62399.1 hypothetical protein [Rhizomicrobium sp.]
MKKIAVLGTVFLTAFWATAAPTQPVPPKPPAKPAVAAKAAATPAANSQAGAAYRQEGFAPGFDDLMTMLIQPRHIKLWYAGAAKNWELAAAESRDLRQSMDRIRQALPSYENNDVAGAVANFITKKLDAVDSAVAAADSARFDAAYKDLTAGCNDCHTYMEHPFLVIKQPESNGYPDQEFKPEAN